LCWLWLFLTVSLAGCGRKPALVPVSGKVTYRGQGVAMATVQLHADTAKGTRAPTATGQTGEDGSVTLQTPSRGPGVVPGHYKVTVLHYFSGIPAEYGNPAETPLRIEVPPAGLRDWNLVLQDQRR
jgi:hypothetical protein